jgi:hypothetical protein
LIASVHRHLRHLVAPVERGRAKARQIRRRDLKRSERRALRTIHPHQPERFRVRRFIAGRIGQLVHGDALRPGGNSYREHRTMNAPCSSSVILNCDPGTSQAGSNDGAAFVSTNHSGLSKPYARIRV